MEQLTNKPILINGSNMNKWSMKSGLEHTYQWRQQEINEILTYQWGQYETSDQ